MEGETTAPTCRVCNGDRSECGPMVKGREYGPEYIGLRHLPNVAGEDRRVGSRAHR